MEVAFEFVGSMAAFLAVVSLLLPDMLFWFAVEFLSREDLTDDFAEVPTLPFLSDGCAFSSSFCTGNTLVLPLDLFFSFISAVESLESCL